MASSTFDDSIPNTIGTDAAKALQAMYANQAVNLLNTQSQATTSNIAGGVYGSWQGNIYPLNPQAGSYSLHGYNVSSMGGGNRWQQIVDTNDKNVTLFLYGLGEDVTHLMVIDDKGLHHNPLTLHNTVHYENPSHIIRKTLDNVHYFFAERQTGQRVKFKSDGSTVADDSYDTKKTAADINVPEFFANIDYLLKVVRSV
jgi:hypothetical protein